MYVIGLYIQPSASRRVRIYNRGMAKRLKTYRIDGELDDAVTAKATMMGETVTSVIERAFREYVEDRPLPRKPGRGPSPEPPLPSLPSRHASPETACKHEHALKGWC